MKSAINTHFTLKVLKVFAWLALVALLIKVGTILFLYVMGFINPNAVDYQTGGNNLRDLRIFNIWYYSAWISLLVSIPVIKALMVHQIINALSTINLANPFSMGMVLIIKKISALLVGIWVMGAVGGGYGKWLLKTTGYSYQLTVGGEFLFMAGLVYVIAMIFQRGVEIQTENDLTV